MTHRPPPPISPDAAVGEVYDQLEPFEKNNHHHHPQQQNRRSLPPVPLSDDNEFGHSNEPKVEEFTEAEEFNRNRKNDNYYLQPADHLDTNYADADTSISSSPLNARMYPVNYQGYNQRQAGSPYWVYPPEATYEGLPFDPDFADENNGTQDPRAVNRSHSQKKMGRAMITGLNTARVKDIRQRLKPTFTHDELADSMDKKQPSKVEDDMEDVDVSSMSVMERMQLLQARAKKAPPSTYPKPRAKNQGDPTTRGTNSPLPKEKEGRANSPLPNKQERTDWNETRTASPSRAQDQDDLPWYFGAADHQKCEQMLRVLNKDGGFLIRMTRKGEAKMQPYVLCIFLDGDVYNFLIRQKANLKFAVGTEKTGEPEFGGLPELVKYHSNIPIEIVSSRRPSGGGQVVLTTSPVKYDTISDEYTF